MSVKNVLLVGESWVSSSTHVKGFDQFGSVSFHGGAQPLINALKGSDYHLTWMKAHDAPQDFPFTMDSLKQYDAIILSDIGSNSILLPQEVWLHGKTMPNRLKLIRDWTAEGGGLMMIGGYFSFQGIDGRARWRRTPVEDALPVTCLSYDDRIEAPEGIKAEVIGSPDHPVLKGLGADWPLLLGANEIIAKLQDGVEVLAKLPDNQGGHPLLVTGTYGKGRSLAWASDIGPHWLPTSFSDWPGYATLWKNALGWIIAKN